MTYPQHGNVSVSTVQNKTRLSLNPEDSEKGLSSKSSPKEDSKGMISLLNNRGENKQNSFFELLRKLNWFRPVPRQ